MIYTGGKRINKCLRMVNARFKTTATSGQSDEESQPQELSHYFLGGVGGNLIVHYSRGLQKFIERCVVEKSRMYFKMFSAKINLAFTSHFPQTF